LRIEVGCCEVTEERRRSGVVGRSYTDWNRSGTKMAEQFVGYAVSITCRNDLGSYQGQICNVDPKEQTITLKKAFKNGLPCHVPQVILR
jgi:hypothetical protein